MNSVAASPEVACTRSRRECRPPSTAAWVVLLSPPVVACVAAMSRMSCPRAVYMGVVRMEVADTDEVESSSPVPSGGGDVHGDRVGLLRTTAMLAMAAMTGDSGAPA